MGAQSARRKDAFNISCGVELNGLSLARQGSRLLQPLSALCGDLAQSEGWPCPAARVQSITTLDTGGWGWGIALVPVLGDEQRCGNKSFSNYIFMGRSTFSPFLGLTSWSLIRVKFKVHSPPVEVLPVRNKLLLVHSSLFFQRIKPQQIRAIFLLNDGTHVGSSARFGAHSLTLALRFDSLPQDRRL